MNDNNQAAMITAITKTVMVAMMIIIVTITMTATIITALTKIINTAMMI